MRGLLTLAVIAIEVVIGGDPVVSGRVVPTPDVLCGVTVGAPRASVKGKPAASGEDAIAKPCSIAGMTGTGVVSFCGATVKAITWNRIYSSVTPPFLTAALDDYKAVQLGLLGAGWAVIGDESADDGMRSTVFFERGPNQRALTIEGLTVPNLGATVRIAVSTVQDYACGEGL